MLMVLATDVMGTVVAAMFSADPMGDRCVVKTVQHRFKEEENSHGCITLYPIHGSVPPVPR
jgi:hypothetical protein